MEYTVVVHSFDTIDNLLEDGLGQSWLRKEHVPLRKRVQAAFSAELRSDVKYVIPRVLLHSNDT